jgi:hypothetical protein
MEYTFHRQVVRLYSPASNLADLPSFKMEAPVFSDLQSELPLEFTGYLPGEVRVKLQAELRKEF